MDWFTHARGRSREQPEPELGLAARRGGKTTRSLGDQGRPMATAVAAAGFELRVWARRPASMDVLGDAPHVGHPPRAEIWAMLQPLHPRPARSPARMSSAHKLPRYVARPRGFEPLTFGSVDRG
jgi:hypothetical protein